MLNIQELKEYLNSINYNNNPLNLLFKNHVSSTNDYLSTFEIVIVPALLFSSIV